MATDLKRAPLLFVLLGFLMACALDVACPHRLDPLDAESILTMHANDQNYSVTWEYQVNQVSVSLVTQGKEQGGAPYRAVDIWQLDPGETTITVPRRPLRRGHYWVSACLNVNDDGAVGEPDNDRCVASAALEVYE